jgi:hypothetical protein
MSLQAIPVKVIWHPVRGTKKLNVINKMELCSFQKPEILGF